MTFLEYGLCTPLSLPWRKLTFLSEWVSISHSLLVMGGTSVLFGLSVWDSICLGGVKLQSSVDHISIYPFGSGRHCFFGIIQQLLFLWSFWLVIPEPSTECGGDDSGLEKTTHRGLIAPRSFNHCTLSVCGLWVNPHLMQDIHIRAPSRAGVKISISKKFLFYIPFYV